MIGARIYSNAVRAEDIACVMAARLGYSIELIAKRNSMSKGAVSYRLKLWGVKVSDYRNGRTPLSNRIFDAVTADSKKLMLDIKSHIRHIQLELKS